MQCGSYGNSSWLSAQPWLITQLASEEGTAVQALAGIPTLCLLPNPVFLFLKKKKKNTQQKNLSFLRKMIMGGTASSASQPYLMSPGSAGVKPDGAASLCCAELLAARKTEIPNLRGLLSCWEMLGLGGTKIKGWGPYTAWKGLSSWAVLTAAFPSLGQTSPCHCQLTCKK